MKRRFAPCMREVGDISVYEVTDFKPSADPGDMIFGVTHMRPGKVGREYFLTRGHIHANANRPEVYYGERGRGVMLLESPEGEVRASRDRRRARSATCPRFGSTARSTSAATTS